MDAWNIINKEKGDIMKDIDESNKYSQTLTDSDAEQVAASVDAYMGAVTRGIIAVLMGVIALLLIARVLDC